MSYLQIKDDEQRKTAQNLDAAYALAGMLGYDSFYRVGNTVRFYCQKLPIIKKTATHVEIIEPVEPRRSANTLAPITNPRNRTEELFRDLQNTSSLYDMGRAPQTENKTTINSTTIEVSKTMEPLLPMDLVLPADYRFTTTGEIYTYLRKYFADLLNIIVKSNNHYEGNKLNVKRLYYAANCFLSAEKRQTAASGLIMPIQIALDGVCNSTDETFLGATKSLQYYNQKPNSPVGDLVKFIKQNSEILFNDLSFQRIARDPEYLKWVVRQLEYYIDDSYLKNGQGYVIAAKESLLSKIADVVSGAVNSITSPKKRN